MPFQSVPPARDKLLFTPGPLTTSATVKQAMLHDAGSWHYEFNGRVARLRQALLQLAGVSKEQGFECVLMQGSGTFGVEAVFASAIPRKGKVAVLSNGAYGERMIQMLQRLEIQHVALRTPENTPNEVDSLDKLLKEDPAISHVAMVHCETTTGILNPLEAIARSVNSRGRKFVVDAMSSFGAIPIDCAKLGIDFLISSANKCLEGVPGFSFVICRAQALSAMDRPARSLSMDLGDQLRGFEKNGQFRYTPPTHSILALEQALQELAGEGGILGRAKRYEANYVELVKGIEKLGFKCFLPPERRSYIITSFCFPDLKNFSFNPFYQKLSDRGFLIYPGKISQADTFRIGTIGRIFPADIQSLVAAIGMAMVELENAA